MRVVPFHEFVKVEVWSDPPFMLTTDIPKHHFGKDVLCLVIDTCMSYCKVFSCGITGWIDRDELKTV